MPSIIFYEGFPSDAIHGRMLRFEIFFMQIFLFRVYDDSPGMRTPASANLEERLRKNVIEAKMPKQPTTQIARLILDRLISQRDQQADTANPVGNRDELEAVRALFGDDFAELSALFRADSSKRIRALRDAESAADAAAINFLTHAFSGSASSIGATSLSILCSALEARARKGNLNDLGLHLSTIEAEYSRIDAELHRLAIPRA